MPASAGSAEIEVYFDYVSPFAHFIVEPLTQLARRGSTSRSQYARHTARKRKAEPRTRTTPTQDAAPSADPARTNASSR